MERMMQEMQVILIIWGEETEPLSVFYLLFLFLVFICCFFCFLEGANVPSAPPPPSEFASD